MRRTATRLRAARDGRRARQRPLDEAVRPREIFDAARHETHDDHRSLSGRAAEARARIRAERKKAGFDVDESAWEQVGDGQVHTTVADLLLWAENFLTGRVGGKPLVKRMTQVGVLKSGEKLRLRGGPRDRRAQRLADSQSRWQLGRIPIADPLMFPAATLRGERALQSRRCDPSKLAQAVAEIFLADEIRRTGKKSPPEEDPQMPAPPAAQWQPAKLADYEGVYCQRRSTKRAACSCNVAAQLVGRGLHARVQAAARGRSTNSIPGRLGRLSFQSQRARHRDSRCKHLA